MGNTEIMNVYFYALYDHDDQQAHSGLTANTSEKAVREDIEGNYIAPRYVIVRRVPELVGILTGNTVTIAERLHSMQNEKIGCDTCRIFGDCLRDRTDGSDCCPDWEVRA